MLADFEYRLAAVMILEDLPGDDDSQADLLPLLLPRSYAGVCLSQSK